MSANNYYEMEGLHATIDLALFSADHETTFPLTNYALPRHPIAAPLGVSNPTKFRRICQATIQRIDQDHVKTERKWQEMGEPEHLNAGVVAELHIASCLQREERVADIKAALLRSISIATSGVAAITLQFPERMHG